MPQDERVRNGNAKNEEGSPGWAAWVKEREVLFLQEGLVGFDLFAPKAAEILQRSPLIRQLLADRFPLMIVDEAQDTGPDAWRCVEMLAPLAQIICLADLEQQIFDHLPGIGPERLDEIKAALKPLEVNLGSENMRSPGSQIAEFGRDILAGHARQGGYKGVSNMSIARGADLSRIMRQAIGCLQRQVKKEAKTWAKTVAILVPMASEATKVSAALNDGKKPVPHKLMFDEDEARLAARFAAFLLEPREGVADGAQIAEALLLLCDIKKAAGSTTAAKQLLGWAEKCKAGKISTSGLVMAVRTLLSDLKTAAFVGDPGRDWILVKKKLRDSNEAILSVVAYHLDYLVAFNRGKRISASLGAAWEMSSTYAGARQALDAALAQDLILDGVDDPDGIQVMTIHKAKGKQFDGVIVLRRERHDGRGLVSNFVWRDDKAPFRRSRKILMVAVTRARWHTLMVQQVWPNCPIMHGHHLGSAFEV